jgi:hypothetical protein
MLLFFGSSVHVASTGALFSFGDVRSHARDHPLRYRIAPAALVIGLSVLAAATRPAAFEWLLLSYFCWQFVHFQRQNLGMAALAASSLGVARLRRSERRALTASGWAGAAALVARPGLLQLHVHVHGAAGLLFPLAATGFAASIAAGLLALSRRARVDRPPAYACTYLVALSFFLPIFVFSSPYAAVGGMTVAHGLQYLLLVGMVVAGPSRTPWRRLRLTVTLLVAVLAGAVLAFASHLHAGPVEVRLAFGAYLGLVTAHFVVDAGLWRLRDEFPRRWLAERVPVLVRSDAPVGVPTDDRSASDIA